MRTLARLGLAWFPALAYMLAIWWLSSRNIDVPLDSFPLRDKGVHFLEYGLLGACFAHAVWLTWPDRGVRGLLAAMVYTVGFGLLDELHQAFVPGRTADLADLLADALGGASFALLFWLLRARSARGPVGPSPSAPPGGSGGSAPFSPP